MAHYDVFISYSHAQDSELAAAIRDGLQTLGKPWNRRRALKVFLDRASLEVSAGLKTSLDADLDASDWLVVLLSPESARSTWVGGEIAKWTESQPTDRLALIRTDGELVWGENDWDWARSSAVPQALSGLHSEEPFWLDLGDYRDRADLDVRENGDFLNDLATLAAPMHGMSKEDLVGEDLRQYRRARRFRRVAIVGLSVLTVLALGLAYTANLQRIRADKEAATANSRQAASTAQVLRGGSQHDTALLLAAEGYRMGEGQSGDSIGAPLNQSTSQAFEALQAVVSHWPAMMPVLQASGGEVRAAAISNNGSRVAAVTADGIVQVWDPANGEERGRIQLDDDTPGDLSAELFRLIDISGDGSTVAVSTDGGLGVVVWDLGSGSVRSLEVGEPIEDEFGFVTFESLSVDETGSRVLASRLRDVVVWDAASGRQLVTIFTGFVSQAELSSDGSMIAVTTGTDVTVFSVSEPDRPIVQIASGRRFGVAFSPDGRMIALAGRRVDVGRYEQGDAIWLWDLTTDEFIGRLRTGDQPVGALSFSADGRQIAAAVGPAEGAQMFSVWSVPDESFLSPQAMQTPVANVTGTAFGRNGAIWASAPLGGGVQLWDAATDPAPGRRFRGGRPAVSSDGSAAVMLAEVPTGGSTAIDVEVLDVGSGSTHGLTLPIESFAEIAISPGGSHIAASIEDRVVIWEIDPEHSSPQSETTVATGTPRYEDGGPGPGPLGFNEDGSLLALSGLDTVAIWNVGEEEIVRQIPIDLATDLPGNKLAPDYIAFGDDGTRLIVSAASTTIWELSEDSGSTTAKNTLAPVIGLPGRSEILSWGKACFRCGGRLEVRDVDTSTVVRASAAVAFESTLTSFAYSPDRSILASGENNGLIRLWDPKTLQQIGEPLRARTAVSELVFSVQEDRLQLVSVSDDGLIIWDVNPDSWLDYVCEQAGRNLSPGDDGEWIRYFGEAVPYHETCAVSPPP